MDQISKSIKPGYEFCVPAIDAHERCGMVVGRYIAHIEPNIGHLIEIFSAFYLTPPESVAKIDRSTRLFRPILCSLRFAEIPKWRILHRNINYNIIDSNFDSIAIAFDTEKWLGGKFSNRSRSEMELLEPSICWRTHHVVFRVNAYLSGIFLRDESYDFHKLPSSLRVDNPEAQTRVIEAATMLDRNIKEASEIDGKPKARGPVR